MSKVINNIIPVTALLLMAATHGLAQSPVPLPKPYQASSKVNLVRTWEATAPEQNPINLVGRPLKDVKQATAYIDGLGRPIQTVLKQGSQISGSAPVDLVTSVVFDEFGREKFKYLPFGANNKDGNTSVSDGLFKFNPFQQQVQFYNTQLSGQSMETNVGSQSLNWAYGQALFEASPLNRVLESFAPGSSWVGSSADLLESNRRSVKTKYLLNTAADSVKVWSVTDVANGWGAYSITGNYSPGQLYKVITIDEGNKQVVEFKDKNGRVVLKKNQITATDNGSGSGHNGWICTYYAYDDLNNLRLIIQPRGLEILMANSWNIAWNNNLILDEQCFRYEYDGRNRMIRKKVPGAGEVWMVYDQWDRLVLTQDANLRLSNKWLFTKYDHLDRTVMTGFFTNTTYLTQATMQGNVSNQNLARYEVIDLTKPNGYTTNLSFPSTGFPDPQTITYYDDYAWTANINAAMRGFDNRFNGFLHVPSNLTYPYAQPVLPANNTKGMVTGTIVKSLDGTDLYATTMFYDNQGRVIQTISENYTKGRDITTTQYNFAGQVLKTVLRHQKFGTRTDSIDVITENIYDDLGRLKDVKKIVNATILNKASSTGEVYVLRNEYDALGQLKKKVLGPDRAPGNSPIENLDYDYNIRGWTLGVNRGYLNDKGGSTYTQKYFGFELGYDKCTNTPGTCSGGEYQYNGNISATVWKSAGDEVRRKFNYFYDELNRFGKADFYQNSAPGAGGTWSATEANFSVHGFDADNGYKMKYDANGNILSMIQHGIKPGSADVIIDALRYKYKQNGFSNQLEQVWDDQNAPDTKLGDFRYPSTKTGASIDYTFDSNGNLKRDLNKGIGTDIEDGIVYNYLNLPQLVTMRNTNGTVKGTISYSYDAAGNKRKKVVKETGVPDKVTLYLGNIVYENDTLQFIGHEEGRIRYAKRQYLNGSSEYKFTYDYFLKDHLGNVRMVLTEQTDTANYLASMEAAYRATENNLFYNIPKTSYAKALIPGGYPADPTTNPNDSLARTNGNGNKVGPALILKVMSGDKVEVAVKSFYKSGGTTNSGGDPLADLLSSLASGIVGVAGESKGALATLSNTSTSPLLGAVNSFRSGKNPDQTGKPKAYLNWILLDEQLKYVAASSGAAVVQGADAINALTSNGPVTVTKNGFLYIYVSNETQNWDVFFDNLAVQHITGPLIEETHYYPFGLTMAGISSRAVGKPENKKEKFQGQEFNGELGIDFYEFKYRSHDPQIGRFIQVDPLSEKYEYNSVYAFSENKVIVHVELEGLEAQYIFNQAWRELKAELRGFFSFFDNNLSGGSKSSVESTRGSVTSKTTVTTTTSTNFLQSLNYIMENNTNAGNTAPLFKTETKTETSVSVKGEVKTPATTVSGSVTTNQNGKTTVEGKMTVKTPTGVDVGINASNSSDGTKKAGMSASVSSDNTTIKAGATLNSKSSGQNFEVSLGVEEKVGNKKLSSSIFLTFGPKS